MSLVGTPSKVGEQLLGRYLPLRDSQAHSQPELHQRKLMKRTAYGMLAGGLGVEVLILLSGNLSIPGILFGVGVMALSKPFLRLSDRPLEFAPPEPVENLPALSQGLGFCRALSKSFPEMRIELDPLSFQASGSCDGYDWRLKVDRESLQAVSREEVGYDNSYKVLEEGQKRDGATKIWRRTSNLDSRHRISWVVSIEDEFTPRPGQPSEHTLMEDREVSHGHTRITFGLPINLPNEPGLGHEGRNDFISAPTGLHHPEFVGEQIAQSLAWLFKPNVRL